MISGIRTPISRGPGASASGPQESTSPTLSPAGPPGQAPDAAKTFIRRPERKRRSIDLMESYKRQTDIYATSSNDKLLQEVMKTFEDIPARVKDYPQMRKDIKTFLETQSDRCLRILFELSGRLKNLETVPKTALPEKSDTTSTSSKLPGNILERLEDMETILRMQLNDLENKIEKGFHDMNENYSDSGADVVDKVIDRIGEVSNKIDAAHEAINHTKEGVRIVAHAAADLEDGIGNVASVVAARSDRIEEVIREVVCEPKTDSQTYAKVTAAKPGRRPALHSMAVTLEGSQETADEVLARVKKAVDARGTGLKINKVRKAKNQTVILGCDSEAELRRVKDRIDSRGEGLRAEPMKNKNPLVVLKDVFLDSDDEETVKAIYSQNDDIFRGLDQEEMEMTIKYKKRTRNPKSAHVVVQVRPKVWQRMTEAGALYLDLQRVRVEDQSPLIQCTKCLAFGHGRKFCTESVDRCSHCGGPHLREQCVDFVAGKEPQCCNCLHSKFQRTDHNAFSVECPVRKKWDYLARTTTAYA